MLTFFRHRAPATTFSPEEHEWLVRTEDELYLFVLKSTDRFTHYAFDPEKFEKVERKNVPAHIRRKSGARLGGHRSKRDA